MSIKSFIVFILSCCLIIGLFHWIHNRNFEANFEKLKPFPVGSLVKLKYNGIRGQVRSHNYQGGFANVLCGEYSPEIKAIYPEEMEPTEVEAKP